MSGFHCRMEVFWCWCLQIAQQAKLWHTVLEYFFVSWLVLTRLSVWMIFRSKGRLFCSVASVLCQHKFHWFCFNWPWRKYGGKQCRLQFHDCWLHFFVLFSWFCSSRVFLICYFWFRVAHFVLYSPLFTRTRHPQFCLQIFFSPMHLLSGKLISRLSVNSDRLKI